MIEAAGLGIAYHAKPAAAAAADARIEANDLPLCSTRRAMPARIGWTSLPFHRSFARIPPDLRAELLDPPAANGQIGSDRTGGTKTRKGLTVHLLLGHPEDPLCRDVLTLLDDRGCPARIVANPLARPSRFVWRLDNDVSASRIAWDGEPPIADDRIAGMLVRYSGWLDPAGWEPGDLAYMQAETQAALLAWVWSLACPVINRLPPALWYRPRMPLLSWQGLLRRCGLRAPEMLVTNVEEEARGFGRLWPGRGGPCRLRATVQRRALSDRGRGGWRGLGALQQSAPVCLADPHGTPRMLCVVGERVVWDGEPSTDMTRLEPSLRRFAAAAGLAFVALALAPTREGICVVLVEPHADFGRFGTLARRHIVEGIVDLLTADADV